jgi:arylsulfatase A-like enzyme
MGKNCFFEASVRVPLIFHMPGKIKPGHHSHLVESVDVLPTLFELAGLPEPYENQGRSLVPLISDSDRNYIPKTAVFSENVIPEVITSGSLDFQFQKRVGIKEVRHPDAKMIRTARWKFNYYPDGYAELYHIASDPHEATNLANSEDHQVVVDTMKDRLLHWMVTADEADQIAPKWLRP